MPIVAADTRTSTPVEPRIPVEHRAVLLDNTDLSIAYVMTNRFDVVGVIDSCYAGLVEGTAWSVNNRGYIQGWVNGSMVLLHSLIMGNAPAGMEIDHINGEKADNRVANLRWATKSQNNRNRGRQSSNTSGLIGVYWHKAAGKWRSQIKVNGRRTHLGYFTDRGEAAIAYDKAVLRQDPEFGVINYPILRDIYLSEIKSEG